MPESDMSKYIYIYLPNHAQGDFCLCTPAVYWFAWDYVCGVVDNLDDAG